MGERGDSKDIVSGCVDRQACGRHNSVAVSTNRQSARAENTQ
jgi:hypothetical protein